MQSVFILKLNIPKNFGSYINIVQSDMNVVLRKRNAIFISPFPAHFQQMSQKFYRADGIMHLLIYGMALLELKTS